MSLQLVVEWQADTHLSTLSGRLPSHALGDKLNNCQDFKGEYKWWFMVLSQWQCYREYMCCCWKINHSHCSVMGGAVCVFIIEGDPTFQLENCQSNSFPIQWRHHHHPTIDSRYKFLVGKWVINPYMSSILSGIVHKAHNTKGDPELGLQRVGATV